MVRFNNLVFGLALIVAPAISSAQITIGAPGGERVLPFGRPNTATYGQTITAPTGATSLNNFSFWMDDLLGVSFNAYVYAWDEATFRATGSAIFTSAPIAGPMGGTPFTQVTVNTGSTAVSAGAMYVLFFSTSGIISTDNTNVWSYSPTNAYAGGTFVYQNNGDDVAEWTGSGWDFFTEDLQFEANFNESVVPEPASMVLLGSGLAGIALIVRRRRKNQVEN